MKIRLTLLFGIITQAVFSQSPPQATPPNFAPKTPEAGAFLQRGEYPVDRSTGVTNISIPLYTIESHGFKLPISLDYHASGIKVDQDATWVGLGWNLNYGAQVILSVRDEIDQDNTEIDNIPTAQQFDDYYALHPLSFNGGPANIGTEDVSRLRDVYVFSSPTANGSFYLDNGTAVVFPPDSFKVVGGYNGFVITDNQGNVYKLNVVERSVREATHQAWYNSAWYVSKITDANNNVIDFIYDDDGDYKTRNTVQWRDITNTVTDCNCATQNETGYQIGSVVTRFGLTTTKSKKIKEIVFNDGQSRVVFHKTDNRLDLEDSSTHGYLSELTIEHKDNAGRFQYVNGFGFAYDYFNAGASNYKSKRLKLLEVANLLEGDSHQFEYATLTMPPKDSFSRDLYGYYNAKANYNMIPTFVFNNSIVSSADRRVNRDVNQMGMLTKVKYATKGYTEFAYETNQYYGEDPYAAEYPVSIDQSCHVWGNSVTNQGSNHPSPNDIDSCEISYTTTNPSKINWRTDTLVPRTHPENNQIDKYHFTRIKIYVNGFLLYSETYNNDDTDHYTTTLSETGQVRIVFEAYGKYVGIFSEGVGYIDAGPKNVDAAGLRIKNIRNYNHDDALALEKQYDYSHPDTPARTSGSLINEAPPHFVSNMVRNFAALGVCVIPDHLDITPKADYTETYSISSQSRFGTESNSIIYQYVGEKYVSPLDSTSNGFTQYKFTTEGDWILNDLGVQVLTPWKRGKVLEKKIYKTNTIGASKILRHEENEYAEDTLKASYVKGFKLKWYIKNFTPSAGTNQAYVDLFRECGAPRYAREGFQTTFLNHPVYFYYLNKSKATDFFYNDSDVLSGSAVTENTYKYNSTNHVNLTRTITKSSKDEVLETRYYYPQDSLVSSEPYIAELIAKNKVGMPLKVEQYRAGVKVGEQLTRFANDASTGSHVLPKQVFTAKDGIPINGVLKITYDKYDTAGNLLQYTPAGGTPVSLIWGYGNTRMIAKIEGINYASIPQSLISRAQGETLTGTESSLLAKLNDLRTDPVLGHTMVTSYTYYPLVGVSTITDPKGMTTYYNYDYEGRLTGIKDADGNYLQETQYHYKN